VRRFYRRAGAWPLALIILVFGIGVASAAIAATSSGIDLTEVMPAAGPDGASVDRQIPQSNAPAHLPTTAAPQPGALPVVSDQTGLGTHFAGLTFHDQRKGADLNADGSANQLSVEPPDQGLCVGNGEVIEAVNDIFATYTTGGVKTSANESMNQFFTGDHEVVRHPDGSATFGAFLSDPRCAYDASTNRFFMTLVEFARDPKTGAFEAPSSIRIATSNDGTPSTSPSDWTFTTIDTTNLSHPNCPCFGDQPLLGVDANGVYISTNEFPINGPGFNGAQIYAVQKSALVQGKTPHIVRIEGHPISPNYGSEGLPYSLQPANVPGKDFVSADNGTIYFVGALEFGKKPFQLDNRISVWALTNTVSLNDRQPDLKLSLQVTPSHVYGFPPAINQPNGPTPLAASLHNPENLLDGGDDRMQVATFAHGHLWAAADTIAKTPTGSTQVATTWYMINASVDPSGAVSASVAKQGYVSVQKDSVTRPSLAVTSSGKVVLGVTLAGSDYFPSAAYTTFDDSANSYPTALHVAAAATVPADGFTGYKQFPPSNGIERWGDYGYAVADGDSVWVANEWIPGEVIGSDLANWGTYVSNVTP